MSIRERGTRTLLSEALAPATTSRRHHGATRMMIVAPGLSAREPVSLRHAHARDLSALLSPGDLLVLNRSATIPASFRGRIARTGASLELRLASFRGRDARDLSRWQAVVLGAGDWRSPTEARGPAPRLLTGDVVGLGLGLRARILAIDPVHPRLVSVELVATSAPTLVAALYSAGRPIQYSYLTEELEVWDQQTAFSGPPISVEPPCVGFAFDWEQLLAFRRRGVEVRTILHAAGLSSTGDPSLDARFPLDEWFEVPKETLAAVMAARTRGNRVVAVGTTVARALESAVQESAACGSAPRDCRSGFTSLRLGPRHRLQAVTSLLTGMHEAGTSHATLMEAFAPAVVLEAAESAAAREGYRSHEYGDLMLLETQRFQST
jgi:S-adenosylmethionine:tRNA ribosyltransferase-isomerase